MSTLKEHFTKAQLITKKSIIEQNKYTRDAFNDLVVPLKATGLPIISSKEVVEIQVKHEMTTTIRYSLSDDVFYGDSKPPTQELFSTKFPQWIIALFDREAMKKDDSGFFIAGLPAPRKLEQPTIRLKTQEEFKRLLDVLNEENPYAEAIFKKLEETPPVRRRGTR